jgi:hypothetical protein
VGRDGLSAEETADILAALADDGFIVQRGDGWFVA